MKREFRFIISFLLLFACVYGFNLAFIGVTAPGGLYVPCINHHANYIEHWRTFNIDTTAYLLKALGCPVKVSNYTLISPGRSGFKLVYSCLGYGIMSFYLAFVMTFPKPRKGRILILVAGLLVIQLLNFIRFLLISLYWRKIEGHTWIDHHLAFNILIYLVVITMLYKWTNSKQENAVHKFKKELQ